MAFQKKKGTRGEDPSRAFCLAEDWEDTEAIEDEQEGAPRKSLRWIRKRRRSAVR